MNPNWAIAAVLAVISGAIFFALQIRRAQAIVAAILRTVREAREEGQQS
ncbi:hypothetical protein ACFV90_36940 [Streptomyces sp. NPDC059904]